MRIPWIVAFALLPLTSAAEIHVVSATYGPNCGAGHDNAKAPVAAACEGKRRCEYTVDFHVLGDPAIGCAKTFVAEWACSVSATPQQTILPAEAGNGSVLKLSCGLPPGAVDVVATTDDSATTKVAETVQVAALDITAISPARPINSRPMSVHFRLNNKWVAGKPLTGWIDAIVYDVSDSTKAGAIGGQSLPIADVQTDQATEGDLFFSTTGQAVNGVVEMTYFQIFGGYTPGPRSSDGVLPDVPSEVKAQLLNSGNARAVATASADFMVLPNPEIIAPVFDFDLDSCYPSAAVSDQGIVNPGMEEQSHGITVGCREPEQLLNSNTYYRMAWIKKDGVVYTVNMYALYFMKDKTVHTAWDAGHRHDWEFALVWTANGAITHAGYSTHGEVETEPRSQLYFDSDAPDHVKVVYHKDDVKTHAMRFAGENEIAENDQGRWITPTLVDWHTMSNARMSNEQLRLTLNNHDYDQANCSFNDNNFPGEIAKHPPTEPGYPSADEWRAAAMSQ